MKKFDVVEWMDENGHPSYKNEIEKIKKVKFMSDQVKEDLIAEIRREAYDRYDDWKTDPLD